MYTLLSCPCYKSDETWFLDLFRYIFGTQTTTNHAFMRYAKILKIKNFQVVMSDEVKDLPENKFLLF